MATNVEMPAMGESITEAVLIRWIKNDGESVKTDEPICELETDKANFDLPSPATGTLHTLRKAGDKVRVGETIARIGADRASRETPAKSEREPDTVQPKLSEAEEAHNDAEEPRPIDPPDRHRSAEAAEPTAASDQEVREPKSTAADFPSAAPAHGTAERVGPGAISFDDEGVRRVPMTKIRRRIAERLVAAQHQAAMLTTFNEVDMTAVHELRARYKKRFEDAYGVPLGLMSFAARACVEALGEFPNLNAKIQDNEIVYYRDVHLGIAVSTDRGLVVPVLRHVERMSFGTIETEIKRVAAAARDGKLSLQELSGGTFTITNGGVFGSLLSTPILNPPQSGILGMHAIQKRPTVVDDQIVIRPMMYVALTYDHRLVDGKDSVRFLVRIKELLEEPARIVLGI